MKPIIKWWKTKEQLQEWLDSIKSDLPVVNRSNQRRITLRLNELKLYEKYLI